MEYVLHGIRECENEVIRIVAFSAAGAYVIEALQNISDRDMDRIQTILLFDPLLYYPEYSKNWVNRVVERELASKEAAEYVMQTQNKRSINIKRKIDKRIIALVARNTPSINDNNRNEVRTMSSLTNYNTIEIDADHEDVYYTCVMQYGSLENMLSALESTIAR